MKTDLEDFYAEQKKLIEEIKSDKLSCLEAQSRCKELWKLIPSDLLVNPFRLNDLMKEKYGNSPDWNYSKVFNITV
jgi:hypothetical protein